MFGLFISHRGVVCGQFQFFVYAQGANCITPGQDPDTGRTDNWLPSISPMCAQARCRFTQVIHTVVHNKTNEKFCCPRRPYPVEEARRCIALGEAPSDKRPRNRGRWAGAVASDGGCPRRVRRRDAGAQRRMAEGEVRPVMRLAAASWNRGMSP